MPPRPIGSSRRYWPICWPYARSRDLASGRGMPAKYASAGSARPSRWRTPSLSAPSPVQFAIQIRARHALQLDEQPLDALPAQAVHGHYSGDSPASGLWGQALARPQSRLTVVGETSSASASRAVTYPTCTSPTGGACRLSLPSTPPVALAWEQHVLTGDSRRRHIR